jgi:protein-disulfide isomerase
VLPTTSTGARRRRAWQLGAVGLFAAILAGVAVVVFGASTSVDLGDLPAQSRQLERTLGGIPQQGVELGPAHAPATLLEFADPQCPFCGTFAREVLPSVVRRYVRDGRLRLRLELLTILGADSERIARLAAAAALQDRAWDVIELAYENQGDDGSGYATDTYLRKIARATPGLDARRALRAAGSAAASKVLDSASAAASARGVNSTPAFFLEQRGRAPEEVRPSDLTPKAFSAALDPLLPQR